MAAALTSFVQPMLIGNQSSNSSIQLSTNDINDTNDSEHTLSVDVCPSPSASNSSIPRSPLNSDSNSQCLGIDKDSSPFSEIMDLDLCIHSPREQQTKTIDCECEYNDEHEKELSISTSHSVSQCRYCYSDIARKSSVSQCHCSGVLCRECLINELKLTHGRAGNVLQCTVCKNKYSVKTEFTFKFNAHCKSFCIDNLIHCGLKDEQYLLESVGGKIGFFLVILGINTWILSTSLLFAFPPNGCPIELYYMVSIFDFAVGVSTIWFIIKCRYLSPFILSIMYFLRTIYILIGWIPSINFLRIYQYHITQSSHASILGYFLVFSFVASSIMNVCWIIDFREQYTKYRKENGKLILNANEEKIEIHDIVARDNDAF